MAKTAKYHVVDVATGPAWAVVMLMDTDTNQHVVAWNTPTESARRECKDRPFARELFNVVKDEIAEEVARG
jgi:hypothetical protein